MACFLKKSQAGDWPGSTIIPPALWQCHCFGKVTVLEFPHNSDIGPRWEDPFDSFIPHVILTLTFPNNLGYALTTIVKKIIEVLTMIIIPFHFLKDIFFFLENFLESYTINNNNNNDDRHNGSHV